MSNKTPQKIFDDGGQAFPRYQEEGRGMSLRDYFAGQALNSLAAVAGPLPRPEALASYCYQASEAMLQERERIIQAEVEKARAKRAEEKAARRATRETAVTP